MPSHKIRTIVATAALATLAAGVTWLAAGPTGADTCGRRAIMTRDGLAGCSGRTELHLNDVPGTKEFTPEVNDLAMAAGRLARQLGLTGLAMGRSVPGMADLGGLAATWGMPSLASTSPRFFPAAAGPAGMEDLSTAAHVAALPTLPMVPRLPGVPLQKRIPQDVTLGGAPKPHNRIIGSGAKDPIGLEKPVSEVGSRVIGELLPRAIGDLGGSTVLPGRDPGVAGLTGLVQGLGLR
ncbi:hypothetical protein MF672_012520 [Actinomadura sp. ATCC 31491]|uniref:Uncharacterized protein n=1 Tax=Actinomadura luzonensis TaxID=2805427 RepID=A0ABT0FQM2_9ACTN|nr:hypothetical protein [Actinomadura luzonensis]MCK2214609.1 hypothetical protein [Actinomadura luzonensis]